MKKTKGLAVIMLLLICFMAFVACDGGVSLIKSVTLTKLPTKVVYNIGEKFDPTGGQITAVMTKDDEVVVVDITADMCGEVDTTKAGKVDVKIGYLEKSVTFQITVVDPSVKTKSIEVTTKPTKVGYLIGEKFSAAGGKLTVTKTDDTKEIIDLTDAMCGTVSTATAGKVAVTVTYQEKSTTFEITVAAPTVSSIAVSANPTKVEYIAGVAFSAVGG
ncbi:MAG: bacterial Ig-like domain-containing protein, partial [Clostridia bacterium]